MRLPSDLSELTQEDLYQHYSKGLRGAVDAVYSKSDDAMADRFRANVSRFAAYKAVHVQAALDELSRLPNKTPAQREQLQRLLLRLFDHRQQAEQNTATARARTAKQFSRFLQPDRVTLFPNLKWLPSRSANPRTTHWAFYNHVWPKNDSFWNNNSPGTEWNCKCDIEETDEPLTDNQGFGVKTPPAGLEGKPWETGELFTDNAGYIREAGERKTAAEAICGKVLRWHDDYMRFKHDTDYTGVEYDYEGGGMIAVHKGHQMHAGEKEERYFEGLTSGELEMQCSRQLMKAGHKVVFVDETRQYLAANGHLETLPTLDILLDDKPMDIRSVTKDSTLHQHLSYKNKQLGNVERKSGIHSDSLCLYFHNPDFFTETKMLDGIRVYNNMFENRTKRIEYVYVVINGSSEVLVYRT